jgi:hypothetical protein
MNLDRLEVEDGAGNNLGDVDGFLVESSSGRPRYVVVDSGGWFRTRRYLLPVEHVRFDAQRKGLTFDLGRDAVRRFPEIPEDRIENPAPDELAAYRREVTRACCPDDEDFRRFEVERENPETPWWHTSGWTAAYIAGAPGVSAGGTMDDRMSGRADERWQTAERPDSTIDRPSERAQPGDVIGVESGGETTSLGDTAEDEDRRRERAEDEIGRRGARSDRDRR